MGHKDKVRAVGKTHRPQKCSRKCLLIMKERGKLWQRLVSLYGGFYNTEG